MRPPKWCQGFVDRHGKPRWYLRRPGFARVPLPGLPWSPEFMAAYEAACSTTPPSTIGSTRSKPGTIAALIKLYCASPEFRNLAAASRNKYRQILERFAAEHGDKRVSTLQRQNVKSLLAAKTPGAAKNLLVMLRMIMRVAVDIGWRDDDPTIGIKNARLKSSEGFKTWTEEDIAAFEATFPLGTQAHLALALLIHTGQRRSDVVRMGRQHVHKGRLIIRQQKTGAEVSIHIHMKLQVALDMLPKGMTFLVTPQGKPFTPGAFSMWFSRRVAEAGLHGLSPHGLRKAVCRRLAEAGCTPHEIMAISGHRTLKEVTRYTMAADRAGLADAAMKKIEAGTGRVKPAGSI